jgi:hypothetical protein
LSFLGTEVRLDGELRFSHVTTDDDLFPIEPTNIGRAFLSASIERPFDKGRLILFTAGGAVGADGAIPPQEWLFFGGPVSAPGYGFHELPALAGVTQRVEWRTGIPAPTISLGRFGKVPAQATIAPFVQATYARHPQSGVFVTPATNGVLAVPFAFQPEGVYPSIGVALQPFFDLLRFEVAKGTRHGAWQFNVDFSRDFWGVL